MSENTLINQIIGLLEKSQNVKIWDFQNQISAEAMQELKQLIKNHVDSQINDHIIKMFGV